MTREYPTSELEELAALFDVQTSYSDVRGERQEASVESLLAVLELMGAPVHTVDDVPHALRERREALAQRVVEPVHVAWDGEPTIIGIRSPSRRPVTLNLEIEGAQPKTWSAEPGPVDIPMLPLGYHHLHVAAGDRSGTSLIVAAPKRAPSIPEKTWGIFLPLYALRSDRSWGTADLTDLEHLLDWTARRGGSMVATLPLLATFLEGPLFDPSPYSPVSRLFWNELYLDVERAPEMADARQARETLASPEFRREIAEARDAELVDYIAAAHTKRRILEPLAEAFFSQDRPERRRAFEAYRAMRPEVADYAAFRAVTEHTGRPWTEWPHAERDGTLDIDPDDPRVRYHTYVQWLAHEQFGHLSHAGTHGGLFLDLPIGVHPHGYDAWRERVSFAAGASGGAPPDVFFTGGQDWGFSPLHPHRIREDGYRHFIAVIRHLVRDAAVLRIDHVMGLHRLFWIPRGMEARRGVYVRYNAEELYAILNLEAHRSGAFLVGEDLGTVPPGVRDAMQQHGIHRTYVLQYELSEDPERPIGPVPEAAFASLNTHDMATFPSFWSGGDLDLRARLGWLDDEEFTRERRDRDAQKAALVSFLRRNGRLPSGEAGETEKDTSGSHGVVQACLEHLARSDGRVVVVNLEDLWGEQRPQNVPGTGTEVPNWRRKARHRLEALDGTPGVLDTLRTVDRSRKGGRRDDERPQARPAEAAEGRIPHDLGAREGGASGESDLGARRDADR